MAELDPLSHPDYRAFLRSICADPLDDTPRLILADWLDEHDMPGRAEFIRVQCEAAQYGDGSAGDEARERAREIETRFGKQWREALPDWVLNWEWVFDRGFLTWVPRSYGMGYQMLRTSGAIAVALSPLLAWVDRLDLHCNGIGACGTELLALSPSLRRLKQLRLSYNSVGDEGATALAASPHLAGLESLELNGNGITDVGATALADSPYLSRELALSCGQNVLSRGAEEVLRRRFRARA